MCVQIPSCAKKREKKKRVVRVEKWKKVTK